MGLITRYLACRGSEATYQKLVVLPRKYIYNIYIYAYICRSLDLVNYETESDSPEIETKKNAHKRSPLVLWNYTNDPPQTGPHPPTPIHTNEEEEESICWWRRAGGNGNGNVELWNRASDLLLLLFCSSSASSYSSFTLSHHRQDLHAPISEVSTLHRTRQKRRRGRI